MKSLYYPLIAGGSLLAILWGCPSEAKEENPFKSSSLEIPEMISIDASGKTVVSQSEGVETSPVQSETSWMAASGESTDFTEMSKSDVFSTSEGVETSPIQKEKFPENSSILAQSAPVLVQQPEIIIDNGIGNNQDLLTPQAPSAPVLPRAIAPPVGDMAVSNINSAPTRISLGTNLMIPRLVLQDAPASKVLEVLAEYAGLNIVYNASGGGGGDQGDQQGQQGGGGGDATITLNFTNESIEDVFNTVLVVSGLKANRQGRTIYVGSDLPPEALNLISRTIRLNQVKSFNAGTFLASQGAEFQRLVTKTEDITDPLTGRVIGRREVPSNLEAIKPAAEGGTGAPLLLQGLRVSTDDRLNSITMVGEPRQVAIATSLLTQLDARRRQVAVNVKVVDVNLNNIQDFSSSFSFGVNDSFFIQDQGAATVRFGTQSPARGVDIDAGLGRVSNPPIINNPFAGGQTFIDPGTATLIPGISGDTVFNNPSGITIVPNPDTIFFDRNLGVLSNPYGTGVTDFQRGTDSVFTRTIDPITGVITSTFERGDFPTITQALPDFFQYPQKFLALIETQIRSGNAKVLTDPTLVVQEGQEATVKLTQKVIESVNTSVDPLSGVRTTTPVLADAGLTLVINVDKVDDNGFVNMSVSPTVAAVGNQQDFDSGDGTVNTLNLLNRRELTSGLVRLRDGQTLILSGVIQESDRTITSKVPILGDIPILGALFRSTTDQSDRTEVIIVVTPQIMEDNTQFGYNYAPGREAADVLRRRGYQIPSQ